MLILNQAVPVAYQSLLITRGVFYLFVFRAGTKNTFDAYRTYQKIMPATYLYYFSIRFD